MVKSGELYILGNHERIMKSKIIVAIIIVFIFCLFYTLRYLSFREKSQEVWSRNNKTYVVFPEDNLNLYYYYRLATYIDAKITDMRFHIGPHRDPDDNLDGEWIKSPVENKITSNSTNDQVVTPDVTIDTSKVIYVNFDELSIGFHDVIFWDSERAYDGKGKDTVILSPELGSTVQEISLLVKNSKLKNVSIKQRYQTSLTVMDEGPHLDLLKWKHYESEWKELEENNGIYRSIRYNNDDSNRFPKFSEEKLYKYILELGETRWAELIKNPTYPDGEKHYVVGISRITFKIAGVDYKDNTIEKIIICEIAMGC